MFALHYTPWTILPVYVRPCTILPVYIRMGEPEQSTVVAKFDSTRGRLTAVLNAQISPWCSSAKLTGSMSPPVDLSHGVRKLTLF